MSMDELDPYNISKGFFHAHIGWMLSKGAKTTLDEVKDLQLDPMIRWLHRHYLLIAIAGCFILPALLGFLWNGWVGAHLGLSIAAWRGWYSSTT
jgi:stearoyl-CoA desaturase (delta-9 desaturase)